MVKYIQYVSIAYDIIYEKINGNIIFSKVFFFFKKKAI